MAYNPATDFLALWREVGGDADKAAMPGLDFVVAALGRAGVLNVVVSGTAPISNESTTAWFFPNPPSTAAEGALYLWDEVAGAYAAATPALFLRFLQASDGQSGVSWWRSIGGPPANTIGNDGDFAIRLDGVGGIYGPKNTGAWPIDPLPGSTNTINQDAMDATFGTALGSLIFRDSTEWVPRLIGSINDILTVSTSRPTWRTLSALMDAVFSATQGSVLYRGAGNWNALPPGAADSVLTSNGPAANPSWTPKSTEFDAGTRMLFHQTSAPTGWTKDTSVNDMGLRVVSGAVSSHAGVAFSTVFAQTEVGGHSITLAEMQAHAHPVVNGYTTLGNISGPICLAGTIANGYASTDAVGGGTGGTADPHTHSVQLNLAYVDVIIAQKDA